MGTLSENPWFSDQGIRSQLGLNDQTYGQLHSAYGQAYSKYNSGMGTVGNNVSPQERQQRMQDLQGKFNQDFGQSVQSSITNPTQRSRYNQLYLQYQGYGAFNDPQIQQKLNLTTQQQQQLQQNAQQYNQQVNTLRQSAQNNPSQVNQQFGTLRQGAMQNMNSVLNPQQQQTWQQMTGQPYNFGWSNYYPTSTTGQQR